MTTGELARTGTHHREPLQDMEQDLPRSEALGFGPVDLAKECRASAGKLSAIPRFRDSDAGGRLRDREGLQGARDSCR